MKIIELVPRQRVGDVFFNSTVQALTRQGYVEDIDGFDDFLRWHTYTRHEGLEFYVKQGRIVCVKCFSNCYFHGENIIGKTPEELLEILGAPDEIGEALWVGEEKQQTPYEFFDLGLQIWFETGQVVSVFCNDNYR
jgi:hypothetical protein